ncbi:ABC transporter permease [Carnimonas bestiolae]|uniref:ABC transporter permease n=1 Tax=Carnimonas bestiolae TaxID=3402172 RepID=UPI003EDC5D8D
MSASAHPQKATSVARFSRVLSPIMRRRLTTLRRNRLAWLSLWVLIVIAVASICAPIIANERPWLVKYEGHYYAPLLKDYPATQFGGTLPTRADFSDPDLQRAIAAHGWQWRAPIPYSSDTIDVANPEAVPSSPNSRHWLGTDDVGRDVLARTLYGVRLSLAFASLITLVSLVVGIVLGGIQGYFGGWVDLLGQRLTEIWAGMPLLYLVMILASMFHASFWWLVLILSLFGWLQVVDYVRAEVLRTRALDYVAAARLMGLPSRAVLVRHVLPNSLVSTLSNLPFVFTTAITSLVVLDYLGFGLPAGAPSIGEMTQQAQQNPHAPWISFSAFITLAVLMTALVFVGLGLRDALDPRHSSVR